MSPIGQFKHYFFWKFEATKSKKNISLMRIFKNNKERKRKRHQKNPNSPDRDNGPMFAANNKLKEKNNQNNSVIVFEWM